jgi:choline/glycine/proline betaine transport protein
MEERQVKDNGKPPKQEVPPVKQRKNKYFDIHAPVFYPAAALILLFIVLTLVIGKPMEVVFDNVQTAISDYGGWFLVISVNIFVVYAIYLAFSRFGNIRLGGRNAKPEFSTFAWFAMLFSAGMGIGLLFFSVAEPIFHFTNPPRAAINEAATARNAMKYTLLHWGMHAWAIYALVGLSLAFFTFNRKLPLTIRSVFYPILGERIHGRFGDAIDVVAVVATLFGLATSLGFGVQQVAAGLDHLFNFPNTRWMQVFLIGIITLAATISVVSGLHNGVRMLSELNMRLGLVFLILLLILGPTVLLLDGFIQNTGAYLQSLLEVGTWTETYTQTTWQNAWTVVYWAWWISWSPFVGIFIARVSRGRTVKEFVLGVLLVPTLLSILWFSVFGGSALYLEINEIGDIAGAVNEDISTALFVMLEQFPLNFITSFIGIVLVTSFFVTSSDSGSLVIDSITSGGQLDAPVGQRIFWAVTEGAVAATLLIGGGLQALQTAALTTGLPFAIILLIMCYSLYLGLKEEHEEWTRRERMRERESYEKVLGKLISQRADKSE